MSFNWIQMRIGEESDRRKREAEILSKLPAALDELEHNLRACVEDFTAAFGADSARLFRDGLRLTATAGAESVEFAAVPELPGFEVKRAGAPLRVQIGVLPGDRLFYLDVDADQYLNMEELTRRILDRVLFPKLKE